MGFLVVPTVTTGDSWSAAQHNTYIRDNFSILWPYTVAGDLSFAASSTTLSRLGIGAANQLLKSSGTAPAWGNLSDITANSGLVASQATGDIFYASSATATARLAKPAGDSFLKNTADGVLSWTSGVGLVHATAIGIYNPNSQEITSSSYTDITGGTLNITITKTCTILMMATGSMGIDNSTYVQYTRPMIDGTAPANDNGSATISAESFGVRPYTVLHRKTGVTAGVITCKLQGRVTGGTGYWGIGGTILLAAIEE